MSGLEHGLRAAHPCRDEGQALVISNGRRGAVHPHWKSLCKASASNFETFGFIGSLKGLGGGENTKDGLCMALLHRLWLESGKFMNFSIDRVRVR